MSTAKRVSFIVMPHNRERSETVPAHDIFKAIARMRRKTAVDYYDLQALLNRDRRVGDLYEKITADPAAAGVYFSRLAALIRPADHYIFYIHWWNDSLAASLELSRQIKEKRPDSRVIFFGPFCAAYHREILQQYAWVDAVFVDLMDEVVPLLAEGRALGTVGNISSRNRGKIVVHQTQPYAFNNRTFISYGKYLEFIEAHGLTRAPFLYYEISQGCRNDCFYCYCVRSREVQISNVDRAVDELAAIVTETGCRHFYFTDSAVNNDNDFLLRFVRRLTEKDLRLRWSAYMIPKDVDADMLKALKKSGCIHIRWGIESANPVMQRKIAKRLDLRQVPGILARAHACGIRNQVSFITGFPHENGKDKELLKAFITENKDVLDCINIYRFKVRRGAPVYKNPRAWGIRLRGKTDDGVADGVPFDEVDGMAWEKKTARQEASRAELSSLRSRLGIVDVDPQKYFMDLVGRKAGKVR